MKNIDAIRATLPDNLILLDDIMPVLGITCPKSARRKAGAGQLPVRCFKLRESRTAPWVTARKDWEAYIKKLMAR